LDWQRWRRPTSVLNERRRCGNGPSIEIARLQIRLIQTMRVTNSIAATLIVTPAGSSSAFENKEGLGH
jgi:hypothetical protein